MPDARITRSRVRDWPGRRFVRVRGRRLAHITEREDTLRAVLVCGGPRAAAQVERVDDPRAEVCERCARLA